MNDYFLIDTAIKRAVLNVRMGRYVNALFPTPLFFPFIVLQIVFFSVWTAVFDVSSTSGSYLCLVLFRLATATQNLQNVPTDNL